MKRRLLITFLLGCLLPFAVQAQHGTFRFAQITDIHFSPNNPNPTEDLLRSVAQINAIDSIDFVLVTGDITEEGDRATMLKVKETLDLLKAKYYVILGNHETNGATPVVLPSVRFSAANALNSSIKAFCFWVSTPAR